MFLNSHIPGAVVCAADKDSSHSGRSEDSAAAPAPGFCGTMSRGSVFGGSVFGGSVFGGSVFGGTVLGGTVLCVTVFPSPGPSASSDRALALAEPGSA